MQEGEAIQKNEITLRKIEHLGAYQIGIFFEPQSQLTQTVRLLKPRWSRTWKCWYKSYSKETYKKITQLFAGNHIKIVTTAAENTTGNGQLIKDANHTQKATVNGQLAKNANHTQKTTGNVQLAKDANHSNIKSTTNNKPETTNPKLFSAANKAAFEKYGQYMVLKGMSPSTMRTYKTEFGIFLQHIKTVPAENFSTERLKSYFYYCHTQLKLSTNTIHSRINALKLYYEQVLHREKFFWEIPRPQKQLLLPKTFNQDEIASIINSVKNKKHKTMLMMAYSAGMRVSEVVALKTRNIDSKRMCILIEQAKGKKDRLVNLSPTLLVMLREYAKAYKLVKNGYLFEGSTKGTPYSTRSLQEVIQAAKQKAAVIKPGSIHALRHSFATHLLDKGTDITMIQKLMGHNDIKTTLRYLHTTNKDLLKIISPLDDLSLD